MGEPIHDLGLELERVAGLVPDRPAVSDPEDALTHGELLSAACELAAALAPTARERPRPVVLLMPHRARTVACMAAALLAGRPYCVLNPAQPWRRIEALLAEIDPEVTWTTDATLRDRLGAVGLQVGRPPTADAPARTADRPTRRRGRRGSVCALYVTSGSTGTPKVVEYRHDATRHRAEVYGAAIGARPGDRFSLVSPLWTAAAASALFTALLAGASVHLLAPGALTTSALANLLRASGISVWHSTPSLFRRLAGAGFLQGNRFRVLRLGGEPVLASDIELARRTCDHAELLVTGYSLTEANGAVTQRAVPLRDPAAALDAGPPIPGVELRIESRGGGRAAIGEEGEIVLGGNLLSAGYAGPTEPVEPRAGTRFVGRGSSTALKTGDRGLLRADGSLEVRGRDDGRMKVRGHRVDPSEVEAATLRHHGVIDAALVRFTPAGSDVTATALFAVADGGASRVTAPSLRAHLAGLVAPEALPAIVRIRDRLPMTESGKVDRIRLARLAAEGRAGRRLGRGPSDPLLAQVQRLFREALQVDEVAPDDEFLGLGGDSLAAAEVCAGLESLYGMALEPAIVIRRPSPRALAEHVRHDIEGHPLGTGRVLQLNPGGREVPLFVVPGAGSDATALVHFAEAIGAHQPVNVIALPGADGRSRPLTRMDRITDHCLAAIQRTGVGPPYRLAGTSFGGLVAYEMAARLRRRALGVEYLGLFDTPAPSPSRRRPLAEPLRCLRVSAKPSVRDLLCAPRGELARLRRPVSRLVDDYRLMLSLLPGIRWHPAIELRFRRLRAGCAIAADRWTPAPTATPLHLYRCDTQPARLAGAEFLGWDRLASSITLRRLPSRHGRHIRPPEVTHLAAMVGEDLERVRRREPPGRGSAGEPARRAAG